MSRRIDQPPRLLRASHVGYRVLEWTAAGPAHARTCGVFQRACNLETSAGRLITLLAPRRPGPATIVVPELEETLGRVAGGQPVIVATDRVEAPEAHLGIDLTCASIWERVLPPDLPLPDPPIRHRAIRAAMEIALERATSPGLVHLLPDLVGEIAAGPYLGSAAMGLDSSLREGMLLQARSAIIQLETIVAAGETEAALAAARGLIGLGLGLTPSGDDFITGLILTLTTADRAPGSRVKGIDAFGRGMVDQAAGRTTPVSLEQLRYAAQGEAEQVIAEAAIALLWARNPLRPAIEALLDLGSSSGGDLLTGICMAVKWLDHIAT